MKFRKLMYTILLLEVVGGLSLSENDPDRQKDKISDPLQAKYANRKHDFSSVESIEDIDASMLRKDGVIMVSSTNSVVFSESLAKRVMDPYGYYSDEYSIKTAKDFIEVSYKSAIISPPKVTKLNFAKCFSNLDGLASASITKGWSVQVTGGLNFQLNFPLFIGFSPDIATTVSLSTGFGGTVSCDIGNGKVGKINVVNTCYTISGVKQRRINIRETKKWYGSSKAEIEPDEDWQEVPEYKRIDSSNYAVTCVTGSCIEGCNK